MRRLGWAEDADGESVSKAGLNGNANDEAAQIEALLSVDETAEALDLDNVAVERLLRQGALRGLELPGGDWRIPASALAEME